MKSKKIKSKKNKNEKQSVGKGNSEILLGIDYGDKKTGLAFGRSGLDKPLKIIQTGDVHTLISEISRVVLQNKITKIIVGLPLNIDGSENKQSMKVRRFVKLLKSKIKKPIQFVSEHASTKESIRSAIRTGISKKSRRQNDHLSAAIILKRYFSDKKYN